MLAIRRGAARGIPGGREAWAMDARPKSCPNCKKTTIKDHRHDITAWVDEVPAEVVVWQCVSFGMTLEREGGSGRIDCGHVERIVLAPGEYDSLRTYAGSRGKRKCGDETN